MYIQWVGRTIKKQITLQITLAVKLFETKFENRAFILKAMLLYRKSLELPTYFRKAKDSGSCSQN